MGFPISAQHSDNAVQFRLNGDDIRWPLNKTREPARPEAPWVKRIAQAVGQQFAPCDRRRKLADRTGIAESGLFLDMAAAAIVVDEQSVRTIPRVKGSSLGARLFQSCRV